MMRIFAKQRQRLSDNEFVVRVIAFLRELAPMASVSLGTEELAAIVRHGITAARSYGLETEQHLVEFTLNMMTIHPRFHEQPQIHTVLTNAQLTADQRMEAILGEVPEDAWKEAAAYSEEKNYWTAVLAAVPLNRGDS